MEICSGNCGTCPMRLACYLNSIGSLDNDDSEEDDDDEEYDS